MKRFFIYASMAIGAGLLLSNIYTSVVDVPAWGSAIPESMETARKYYSVSNPGDFFRIFSPMNQLLALLSLLFFWKRSTAVRYALLLAFVFYVTGEGMTFLYFYPRNDIMFKASGVSADTLQHTWQEWKGMNWVRTAVVAAGLVCSAIGLHRSYRN